MNRYEKGTALQAAKKHLVARASPRFWVTHERWSSMNGKGTALAVPPGSTN